jgi:hypothetical protein
MAVRLSVLIGLATRAKRSPLTWGESVGLCCLDSDRAN